MKKEVDVMTTALASKQETRLARPLRVLVPLIKQDIADAEQSSREYYASAGAKLHEARTRVENGSWGNWLAENFNISTGTASEWMKYAGAPEVQYVQQLAESRHGGNAQVIENIELPSLHSITRPDDTGRPKWVDAVKPIVNAFDSAKIERMAEDRAKENKVRYKLAIELIDLGYKILATKLHPDKGDTSDAMPKLNEVRKELKSYAEGLWRQ